MKLPFCQCKKHLTTHQSLKYLISKMRFQQHITAFLHDKYTKMQMCSGSSLCRLSQIYKTKFFFFFFCLFLLNSHIWLLAKESVCGKFSLRNLVMYMLFCYFVFVCICYIFYITLYIYTGKLCCLVFVAHVSSVVSERKAELGPACGWGGANFSI